MPKESFCNLLHSGDEPSTKKLVKDLDIFGRQKVEMNMCQRGQKMMYYMISALVDS